MESAIRLSQWFVHEWRRTAGRHLRAAPDPDNALLEYLEDHGGRVRRTDLVAHIKRYREPGRLDEALAKFGKAGRLHVSSTQPNGLGRPAEWVELANRRPD